MPAEGTRRCRCPGCLFGILEASQLAGQKANDSKILSACLGYLSGGRRARLGAGRLQRWAAISPLDKAGTATANVCLM